MTFLRNTWYVAAWSDEVGQGPLGRTLLEERVVLFRDAAGKVIAASDLCPHRFAPLHLGQVVDGAIECPYHGLRFDGEGRCVYNPDGEGRVPNGARLRTYPVVERWACAWIWMGDPQNADPALIPTYEFLDDPEHHRPVKGLLHVRANYRFINDNLMDNAHVRMVHHESLHSEPVSKTPTILERTDDGGIWAKRLGENGPPPPVFDLMWRTARGDYDFPMDHWAEARWNAPALVMNNTGITPHGHAREAGIETKNSHFLTPETTTTTHYFWSICRNFELDDASLDEQIHQGAEHAFVHEDEVMLHAVQEAMGDREFWSMRPALLQADIGAVALRRALDKMIADEQAAAAPSLAEVD